MTCYCIISNQTQLLDDDGQILLWDIWIHNIDVVLINIYPINFYTSMVKVVDNIVGSNIRKNTEFVSEGLVVVRLNGILYTKLQIYVSVSIILVNMKFFSNMFCCMVISAEVDPLGVICG